MTRSSLEKPLLEESDRCATAGIKVQKILDISQSPAVDRSGNVTLYRRTTSTQSDYFSVFFYRARAKPVAVP